jgi:hypothetical protein
MSEPQETTAPPGAPPAVTATQLAQALTKPKGGKKPVETGFPVGTKVRYTGTQRLFAGYQGVSILEPGIEYVVVETEGTLCLINADVLGIKYELVISSRSKGDWTVV